MSGIDVAFVALPLSMALSIAAGATPIAGLYTAIVGGAVAALTGGSRLQISGPTAAFVVILAPIMAQHGMAGLTLAGIMAGIILILMGLSGMGSLIKYIPYPVTTGYNTGIAIIIATLQIRDLLGLSVEFDRTIDQQVPMVVDGKSGIFHVIESQHINGLPNLFHEKLCVLWNGFCHTPWPTILHTAATGLVTLLFLVFYPRWFPRAAKRLPPPLAGIIIGTAFVMLTETLLCWSDIPTVHSRFGDFSRSLPPFNLEFFTAFNWNHKQFSELLMSSTTIALLCAIASLLSAVVADGMAGTRHDANSELIGQGLGNIASPLFGGIAVSGAVARTVANTNNGAKSPLAALSHCFTLLLMLLIAAPYIGHIPMASLGAVLLLVAYNMANIPLFRRMLDAPPSDVLVLLTCLGLTVFMDMAVAVSVGTVLAAMLFMRRMSEMTRIEAVDSFRGDVELQSHNLEATDIPRGVTLYNVDGPFFFGASEKAITAMENIGGLTRIVVLRLNRVPVMDASGLYALEKILEHLRKRKMHLVISGVRQQPREVMEKTGFLKKLGPENIASDIEWALVRCYDLLGSEAKDRHTGGTAKMPSPVAS